MSLAVVVINSKDARRRCFPPEGSLDTCAGADLTCDACTGREERVGGVVVLSNLEELRMTTRQKRSVQESRKACGDGVVACRRLRDVRASWKPTARPWPPPGRIRIGVAFDRASRPANHIIGCSPTIPPRPFPLALACGVSRIVSNGQVIQLPAIRCPRDFTCTRTCTSTPANPDQFVTAADIVSAGGMQRSVCGVTTPDRQTAGREKRL